MFAIKWTKSRNLFGLTTEAKPPVFTPKVSASVCTIRGPSASNPLIMQHFFYSPVPSTGQDGLYTYMLRVSMLESGCSYVFARRISLFSRSYVRRTNKICAWSTYIRSDIGIWCIGRSELLNCTLFCTGLSPRPPPRGSLVSLGGTVTPYRTTGYQEVAFILVSTSGSTKLASLGEGAGTRNKTVEYVASFMIYSTEIS